MDDALFLSFSLSKRLFGSDNQDDWFGWGAMTSVNPSAYRFPSLRNSFYTEKSPIETL